MCVQSVTVIRSAVFLLVALTTVSVSVKLEPQGGAVTPAYLDTRGERAEPAAQVGVTCLRKHTYVVLINN